MPYDPPFSGYIQPPDVPPDPTGDCWRGPMGPPGPPGPIGTGDASNTPVTATGSTTPRMLNDRFADWLNVKDFGAKLDGVTDDSAAFNAARTAAVRGQTIYVPEGKFPTAGVVWTSPDMAKQVKWLIDGGVTFPLGGAVLTLGPTNSGDITQGTLLNPNGVINFLGKRTNPTLATDLYRMDYILDGAGGLGQIGSGITMNGVINDGNDSAMWLMNIVADSNASNPASSGLVGLSVTTRKNAAANTQGIHISALDTTGLPSSSNGGRGFSALESANRANGIDDASNSAMWGGVGNRVNMHVSSTLQQSLTNETNFSYMVWGGPDAAAPHLYVKSMYGISVGAQTYQVFDARGGIPPYVSTNPVIALNMQAGMVVDFNGGPALNSAPGNYLQYTTTGTPRLRYMKGTTELWSVSDAGSVSGSVIATGSTTSRTLADRFAESVNVKDFGAVGDGVADDTVAINAALNYLRAHSVGQHTIYRLVFPYGRYVVTAPLNFTGFIGSVTAGVVDGQGSEIWAKHTGVVIDCLGSRTFRFHDLTIYGDPVTIPRIGIQVGRTANTGACDEHLFYNVSIWGNFSFTAFYSHGAEVCAYYSCAFRNSQTGADKFCMVLDGLNHWGVSSTFVTVTAALDTPESFLDNLFSRCIWQGGGSTGVVWLSVAGQHRYQTCYASCTDGSIFTIYQPNIGGPAANNLNIDCHCETTGLKYAVLFTGAAGKTAAYVQDFSFEDHICFAETAVFGISAASSLTSVELRGATLRVGMSGTVAAPKILDAPAKWSIHSIYSGLTAGLGSTLPAFWTGRLDNYGTAFGSFETLPQWQSTARPTPVPRGTIGYAFDIGRLDLYDGSVWCNHVRLDGDTMTGPLTLSSAGTALTATNNVSVGGTAVIGGNITNGTAAGSNCIFSMVSAAGTVRQIWINSGGFGAANQRWTFGANGSSEGGSNAGSDFVVGRYSDTGSSLGNALTIFRSSGLTYLSSLQIAGNAGFNNAAPIAKPTVSGAKGSNAALASLLTALAAYGLISDTTTA